MRFTELLRVLLLGQCRGLLLQSHLVDLGSRRIELLAGGEAGFVCASHFGGDRLLAIASRGQSLLCRSARGELSLQRRLHRLAVDLSALAGELLEQALLLCRLGLERFAAPGELGQALAAPPFGEARFLSRELRGAHALAATRERGFRLA